MSISSHSTLYITLLVMKSAFLVKGERDTGIGLGKSLQREFYLERAFVLQVIRLLVPWSGREKEEMVKNKLYCLKCRSFGT